MTKTEFVWEVAHATNLPIKQIDFTINAAIKIIRKTVCGGDKVYLAPLGTFSVRDYAERPGHNPRTGEPIVIPAHKAPHFKPSPNFKEACNRADKQR